MDSEYNPADDDLESMMDLDQHSVSMASLEDLGGVPVMKEDDFLKLHGGPFKNKK